MTLNLAFAWRLTMAAGLLSIGGAAHGRTFFSPMGEPFRTEPGEKLPEELWFEGADKNGDGKITRAEFLADAGRWFRILDVNHNGEIGPEEIEHYEEDIAPEVSGGGFDEESPKGDGGGGKHKRGGGGGGGGHGGGGEERGRHGYGADDSGGESSDDSSSDDQPKPAYNSNNIGAARFSYLDIPEPVASADTDFNRGVSPSEFVAAANQRFDTLDVNHDGVLTREELPHLSGGGLHGGHGGRHGPPAGNKDAPSPGY
jgi:hypothetical protein